MSREIGRKIFHLRKHLLNETQEVFGERFGVEQATVSRWEEGKMPQRKFQKPIAELANMSVAEFFFSDQGPRLIPVVGELRTGGFELMDKHQPGAAVDHISLSLGDSDQIAVKIKNQSMAPTYREGDTLIAKRLTRSKIASAIGHDCIVKTAAGEGHIRILRKGSKRGLYRLLALGRGEDDIEDVELEWAAPIIWIGRAQ
jgi:transcriptional regulator with XRE-family HTH domain